MKTELHTIPALRAGINRPGHWRISRGQCWALGAICGLIAGCGLWYGVAAGKYAAGKRAGFWKSMERVEGIVRARRVYLAPLKMDAPFQTVSDCIFVDLDPNDFATVEVKGHHGTVDGCVFTPKDWWNCIKTDGTEDSNDDCVAE